MHYFGMGTMWWLWISVIVLVVWIALKMNNGGGLFTTKEESPMEILKKRYAKGEISTEEYNERKKELEKD